MAAKLGIVDVNALADSLSDEQLSEWMAVAIIDGWYNGWTHTAELLSAINSSGNRLLLTQYDGNAARKLNGQMDWRSGYEVAEAMTNFDKPKPKYDTPEQAQEIFKRMFG